MKDKYNGEQVLVFEKALFEELGYFSGTCRDTERYISEILKKGNNRFHDRCSAEQDTSLKQIIPYVVFKYKDEVFSYVRGKTAGEKRLVGNRSIGIGGHVNPVDRQLNANGEKDEDMDMYLEAVKREISEEVVVEGLIESEIIALLNDDSNEVGKVHFGIVHLCTLQAPTVRKREQQITESGFSSIEKLKGPGKEELESWSQHVIELL